MPSVLLTRPKDAAEAFAATLAPHGWRSVIWPLTRIEARLCAPINLAGVAGVVFTSARAVGAFRASGSAAGTAQAFCVGAKTAGAARAAGFSSVENASGDAAALVETIAAKAAPAAGRLAHIRGAHAAGDVAAGLIARGFDVEEIIAYEAVRETRRPEAVGEAIEAKTIAKAAFFSPRAAEIFADLAPPAWRRALGGVAAVAISANAGTPLHECGFSRVEIAAAPNAAAMRAAICGAA